MHHSYVHHIAVFGAFDTANTSETPAAKLAGLQADITRCPEPAT